MVRKADSVGDGGEFRRAEDVGRTVKGRKVRTWGGEVPKVCDVCKHTGTEAACLLHRGPFGEAGAGEVLIDGATVWGPWALMCERGYRRAGRGIGQGVGQRYERMRLDSGAWAWVKVAG